MKNPNYTTVTALKVNGDTDSNDDSKHFVLHVMCNPRRGEAIRVGADAGMEVAVYICSLL
jgi:hypothetical protein